jgi:hypothetical protein
LCPRGFKAVAFEWWAEKHCPPYNLIEIRTKAVILKKAKEFQPAENVDGKEGIYPINRGNIIPPDIDGIELE